MDYFIRVKRLCYCGFSIESSVPANFGGEYVDYGD
jgi:hypothetical protein